MNKYTIVIHGGAGNIHPGMMTPQQEDQYRQGLEAALHKGYEVLEKGGAALDAVTAAITVLEDDPVFNAGRGSVFTKKGLHEMDAAVMNGSDLRAGAVAGVRNIRNPILLAADVMNHSQHVFLSGKGAGDFALSRNFEFVQDDYFFNKERYDQWIAIRDSNFTQLDHAGDNLKGAGDHKFGTVGAVACDRNGNLAAGTSTGGMTNKQFGRIGDSPVIGAGTYANNRTCAISCTGHGEFFLRAVASYDVSCLMEYRGYSLEEATHTVVREKLLGMGGEGGMIAVDATGSYTMCFNSAGMYRGVRTSEGVQQVAWYGL